MPWRALVPEYRKLPPNHLRIRVGVGNRLFNNQPIYLLSGADFWLRAFSEYQLGMDGTFIDIGSGCGRYAHWLRDADVNGLLFRGRYIGIDVDAEALEWCRSHFDDRFVFHLSTHRSTSYNQPGSTYSYRVPEPDGVADLVFSASLFTHLLEPQAYGYLCESARLLKPGGIVHHTVFLIDRPPSSYGRRHLFAHKIGRVFIEDPSQPEAAVAYLTSHILELAALAGLEHVEIDHQPGNDQAILRARKPAGGPQPSQRPQSGEEQGSGS